MRTRLYRNGRLEKEDFPVAEVSDYVVDRGNVVWFDLCSPTVEELNVIGEELGLHELAVEDVHNNYQRPKVDIYENHLFIAIYATHFDGQAVSLTEIDLFVTANALVTVRQRDDFDIDEVLRRWDAASRRAAHGVSFLLHGLLDHVVDGHLAVVQELDARAEELEDALFEDQPSDGRELQRRMYDLRKATVRFRKVAMPMREIVGTLRRRDQDLLSEPMMIPYFEDVYDHALRAGERVEALRDLLANMRETRLAQQGFRLNEIMKRLTSWAAIIAVPTAITGFYGQNVPYPGEGEPWGFWASLVLVAVASVTLYAAFKKKDWL